MLLWKLRRIFTLSFFRIGLLGVVVTVLGYIAIAYLGLWWADEQVLLAPDIFFYWLVVTASTVGYGDFSPTTTAGKIVTSVWVIPVGLSVFGLIIARTSVYVSKISHLRRKGLYKVMQTKHTIIIGWNGPRTMRLIQLLQHKDNRSDARIVLCVAQDMENPLPGAIEFVRVESFTDAQGMQRTHLAQAERIIIDTPQDDITMTTALFCDKQNPNAHKTVYFQDESLGNILTSHCSQIEVVPSVDIEMLVKSAIDPGSSALHKELLDGADGMTQYSLMYTGHSACVRDAFIQLREQYDATLIGLKKSKAARILVNPALDIQIETGDVLYYVSDARVVGLKDFATA